MPRRTEAAKLVCMFVVCCLFVIRDVAAWCSGIGLIPEGMELVSEGLMHNSTLTTLDLSCNALGK